MENSIPKLLVLFCLILSLPSSLAQNDDAEQEIRDLSMKKWIP